MFLRAKRRFKDGKEHRYWSLVENRRVAGGRVVQRQVLYLGEINDAQRAAWCKSIEVLEPEGSGSRQMALFPDDRPAPELAWEVVQVRLSELSLHHPRQFGGCWLALRLWEQLDLDGFWAEKLSPSRKGTRWLNVLKVLVCQRLLAPRSEWRLHRQWFGETALADLLGEDLGVAEKDTLYRCLDRLLSHIEAFFKFLRQRWQSLFGVRFDVLLYDLTNTYFECVPAEEGPRKFGYSRDKRSDCVQVVIALIVTPEGLPLAYEVMPGNTSDETTLADFLKAIERQYGQADRTWVMDRGIPTEETLALMRQSDPPVHYLVGTPKGRLTRLERSFLTKPWAEARESVQVKLLEQDGELYVSLRPIYHQLDHRIEAHIFVAFIAYCLQVTLKCQARQLAPGLTPRASFEKSSAIQMVDVHLPTTDGRHLILPRYTQPNPDQQLLLQRLKLTLPQQPPPRIQPSAVSSRQSSAASL